MTSADDFEAGRPIISVLEALACTRTKKARHKSSGGMYTLKLIVKGGWIMMPKHNRKFVTDWLKRVRKELQCLQAVCTSEVSVVARLRSTCEDSKYPYLALDFRSGGDFNECWDLAGEFTREQTHWYAGCCVLALHHSHPSEVIYRYLCPDSCVVVDCGQLQLADSSLGTKTDRPCHTLCGFPENIAPEMILCNGYGRQVDLWMLGYFVYEMLIGFSAFGDEEPMAVNKNILTGNVSFPKEMRKKSVNLARLLLTADVSRRGAIADVCSSDFSEGRDVASMDSPQGKWSRTHFLV